jgi:hypothetical protein
VAIGYSYLTGKVISYQILPLFNEKSTDPPKTVFTGRKSRSDILVQVLNKRKKVELFFNKKRLILVGPSLS